jgi:hypothetical protein
MLESDSSYSSSSGYHRMNLVDLRKTTRVRIIEWETQRGGISNPGPDSGRPIRCPFVTTLTHPLQTLDYQQLPELGGARALNTR